MSTVNSSKKIVWVGNNPNNLSDIHNISEVVYCDSNRFKHKIWPCTAELTNIFITELSNSNSDTPYQYTLSNPQYNNQNVLINGDPSIYLKPETEYAITGTIVFYKEAGTPLKTVQNCYFFEETQSRLENNYPLGITNTSHASIYGNRLPNDGSGTAIHNQWQNYATWMANDTAGHISAISVQLGWYGNDTYVQNGYLFDTNYQTPIILKRADITQQLILSNISGTPSSTADIINSPVTLHSGESITFWPKFHKTASDTNWGTWNKYVDITLDASNDFSYDSSTVQIIDNQNGSWTIKPLVITNGISNVTISSGGYSFNLGIICIPNTTYDLRSQGNSILGTTIHNLINPLTIVIWDTVNNIDYSGSNYLLHTSDASVASVNGKVVIPNPNNNGNTATIWAEVEGVTTGSFTVEVGNVVTYYSIQDTSSSATPTYNTVGNTITLSASTNSNYSVRFFGDNQGNYERIPYYESVSGGRPIMVQSQGINNSMLVTVLGTATSGATLSIPLYFNSAMSSGTEFTTLVITVS